jgi:phenylacetate-coenzyme A ligase PaaK-like adenylate-forming protein
LHLTPAGLWAGGEVLSRSAHAAIEAAFECPLLNEYGASECLTIGHACRERVLHVNADWVVLEPVDRDYQPTPPGELSHTVLLTNLANFVQPIIRYDLGDRVRIRTAACACGSALPAIDVEGRCDDVATFPARDGTLVRLIPLALTTVIEEAAHVYRFQIVSTRRIVSTCDSPLPIAAVRARRRGAPCASCSTGMRSTTVVELVTDEPRCDPRDASCGR